MALEEQDISAAIFEYSHLIGHVHLADSNRRLPGLGTTDFTRALESLAQIDYSGWLVLECDQPGSNLSHADWYMQQLPESLALIRRVFRE